MQAHVHCAYTSAAQKYSGFDYLVLVRPILCFFELDLQYIYLWVHTVYDLVGGGCTIIT